MFLFCPAVWFGVIFIRHGLYQDGVFKFTVYIPDNYPDGDCPVSGGYTLASLRGQWGGLNGAFRMSWFFSGPNNFYDFRFPGCSVCCVVLWGIFFALLHLWPCGPLPSALFVSLCRVCLWGWKLWCSTCHVSGDCSAVVGESDFPFASLQNLLWQENGESTQVSLSRQLFDLKQQDCLVVKFLLQLVCVGLTSSTASVKGSVLLSL